MGVFIWQSLDGRRVTDTTYKLRPYVRGPRTGVSAQWISTSGFFSWYPHAFFNSTEQDRVRSVVCKVVQDDA